MFNDQNPDDNITRKDGTKVGVKLKKTGKMANEKKNEIK